jgi:hypothetical protein
MLFFSWLLWPFITVNAWINTQFLHLSRWTNKLSFACVTGSFLSTFVCLTFHVGYCSLPINWTYKNIAFHLSKSPGRSRLWETLMTTDSSRNRKESDERNGALVAWSAATWRRCTLSPKVKDRLGHKIKGFIVWKLLQFFSFLSSSSK